MGAQGQSTLCSPRWAKQGQLLPVWRSKRKSHSYGHYSRFALNWLYLLVTSWSLLCRGSIVQFAKCEFFLKNLNLKDILLETICRKLGLIDVLGYWCQLDYTSWLQAPRFYLFFQQYTETLFSAAEHPYATDVEWDPTGRYVVTYVSHWIRSNDNEYQVWSFLGRRLRKENKVCKLKSYFKNI